MLGGQLKDRLKEVHLQAQLLCGIQPQDAVMVIASVALKGGLEKSWKTDLLMISTHYGYILVPGSGTLGPLEL